MTPAQPMPQGAKPPGGPQAPDQGGAEAAAMQAIDAIKQGFMALGKVMQSAGGQLPPEDLKLFQGALQATDAMIQSLTAPADDGEPDGDEAPQKPSQPMAANANAGARPAGPQGR